MNFTALDFETANQTRASVCAIGLLRVEGGIVKARIHQLIRPDSPFNYMCTMVHGIREFDVRNAPSFPEFWEEIRGYFGDNVVAHNAPFDISCLRESLKFYGLEFPSFDYICTLQISRRINNLPSHSLDFLARHFGVELLRHHNALEDACACARLFEIFSKETDVSAFKKPFSPFAQKIRACGEKPKLTAGEKPEWKSAEEYVSKLRNLKGAAPRHAPAKHRAYSAANLCGLPFEYADIDFSKNFVVVGRFANITRSDAESLILRLGGSVSRKVRADTDYIVVGSKRQPEWEAREYGPEIDSALQTGRAVFISESHFLKQCY